MTSPQESLRATARAGQSPVEVDPGVWLVTEPAVIEHLLASENVSTDRAGSRTAVTAWGPDGLGRWMAARRVMRPVLAASHVASFIPSMTRMARRVSAGWAGRADIGAMAEAEALISAVNSGYVLGDHPGQVPSLIARELDAAERSFWRRRLLRAQRTTYAAIRDHVRSRDVGSGGHGLMDVLARAGFDEHAVVLALRSMLLAGFRVPAAALAWILHELAAHPAAQDEARREAAAFPEDATSIDRLGYCQAVVRETLRLHPPVWQFRRRLTARTAAGARILPANDSVLFSSYVSQRDERVYAHPDEFRPERWLDTGFHPRLGSYFPFGAGPRFCPGSQLAVIELAVLVATVLSAYHVEIRHHAAPGGGMLHAPYGAHLRVT